MLMFCLIILANEGAWGGGRGEGALRGLFLIKIGQRYFNFLNKTLYLMLIWSSEDNTWWYGQLSKRTPP